MARLAFAAAHSARATAAESTLAIPDGLGQAAFVLLPGESTWVSVTFQVKLHCPAPLPVEFSLGYLVQGHTVIASLPGFPDLGQVPYSGCPPPNTESDSSSELITHAPGA